MLQLMYIIVYLKHPFPSKNAFLVIRFLFKSNYGFCLLFFRNITMMQQLITLRKTFPLVNVWILLYNWWKLKIEIINSLHTKFKNSTNNAFPLLYDWIVRYKSNILFQSAVFKVSLDGLLLSVTFWLTFYKIEPFFFS